MKCFRNLLAGATMALAVGIVVKASLSDGAQNSVAQSVVEVALFRLMSLPAGNVLALRAPVESRAQLTTLLEREPRDASLYALRAQEDERQLDFATAESDWKRAADLSTDKAAGYADLASFFHRRLEPSLEIQARLEAAKQPLAGRDRFLPSEEQQPWRNFTAALEVSKNAQLPVAVNRSIFEAWIARYPHELPPYDQYFSALIAENNAAGAGHVADQIKAAFPGDQRILVSTEARLASIGKRPDAVLAVYSQHFSPLWPAGLQTEYYQLLAQQHQLRQFLAEARAAAANQPADLAPVLRLYFYYKQQQNEPSAEQALLSWEARKQAAGVALAPAELQTVAPLFAQVHNYDEAARCWYLEYQSSAAAGAEKERALGELISLLLDAPEQSISLGRRDLSLYRNIATMDRHPGFLNGILSLALNTTQPAYQYETASQTAIAYFHRAAASRLLTRMEKEFTNSSRLDPLRERLFAAYAVYGQDDALMTQVPAYLQQHSDAPGQADIVLLLGDAYSRHKREQDEFALYDRTLAHLAEKSDHVPLGERVQVTSGPALPSNGATESGAPAPTVSTAVRFTDYSRVLDRYVARLTQLKRLRDVVALYRRELDHNPDDAGLYERLAAFVNQNRFDADLEQTYRQAFQKFQDTSWASKLARYYLRKKQYDAYEKLARDVTGVFKGSDLAAYLQDVAPRNTLNPVLYRQINLFAHQRFPHNLIFVRNLLYAYQAKGTVDDAAYEKLLRENWFYASDLRQQFFAYLSRTGKLTVELAALPKPETAAAQHNTAALQFWAEGHAWRADYEAAATGFVRLAELAAGDRDANQRAVTIERSLAPLVPGAFENAIQIAEQDVKAAPRDHDALTRVGELYADRELYAKAAPWWNRIPETDPGQPNGYIEAATVFWDYFQYDQALHLIATARARLKSPAQFAYEAGAIYENKNDLASAVREYVGAALESPGAGANGVAKARLIQLARRKEARDIVEQQTIAEVDRDASAGAWQLRLALLENQGRREEMRALLLSVLGRLQQLDQVDTLRGAAVRLGFDDVSEKTLERTIALSNDPVEKLRARMDLASFRETHQDQSGAQRDLSQLLQENPALLGVIRANVDFYWRTNQRPKAVSILESAAGRAQAPYRDQLYREAITKASDAGQFDEARKLIDHLLSADADNSDLLAAKASTYAREGKTNDLIQFYAGEVQRLQASPLSFADKTERIAGLRRGYINALITASRYPEALDQYIELLNRYPEDEGLARETARFAETQKLSDKLIAFYQKTAQASPKDYRWPLLLARIETTLLHYQEAVDAYNKAAYVRPDRTDILIAKADLEKRLLRFGDAIQTNQKLYDLSYHNVQYLEAQADLNRRLGNRAEAIKLLRAVYVDPHPTEAAGYVMVARRLSDWRDYPEALQALNEATQRLQADDPSRSQVNTERGKIHIILRQQSVAFQDVATLAAARRDKNVLPVDVNALGATVKRFFTPEEKQQLATLAGTVGGLPRAVATTGFLNAAGLNDLLSQRLTRAAVANAKSEQNSTWRRLVDLQTPRLRFERLGRDLELVLKATPPGEQRDAVIRAAAEAYRQSGDAAGELRVASIETSNQQPSVDPFRFAQLFSAAGGDSAARLRTLGAANSDAANAVLQYTIAHSTAALAQKAIEARGASLTPLWTNAYTALTGLYFLSTDARVPQAFDAVLGPRTVGEQLAAKTTWNDKLRDGPWYYYAARYGDYLSYQKQKEADDLLPAEVESSPAASDSYVQLGDDYCELKQDDRAAQQYQNALQISPRRADVFDRLAEMDMRAGRRADATQKWRQALGLLAARVEEGPLPASYWETANTVLAHSNVYGLTAALRPNIDAMLRAYIKRNGAYNFTFFETGLLQDAPDRTAVLHWLIDLSRLPTAANILEELLSLPDLQDADRDVIYRARIDRAKTTAAEAAGAEADSARDQLRNILIDYAHFLDGRDQSSLAWQTIVSIEPDDQRPKDSLLLYSALSGHLDELLKQYKARPEMAPAGETVLSVAATLKTRGHTDLAEALQEWEYTRELAAGSVDASTYLGLARLRLEQKRDAEALQLIRNVTLSIGTPFEHLGEAITVLENAGRKPEAKQYAAEWHKADPTNPEAWLAEARLNGDTQALDQIRQAADVPYLIRVSAAKALAAMGQNKTGLRELDVLTRLSVSPAEANHPFFLEARVVAASSSKNVREQAVLYREAIAVDTGKSELYLPLARAAFASKQDALGLAAWTYFQQSGATESAGATARDVQEMAAAVFAKRGEYDRSQELYDQLLNEALAAPDRTRLEQERKSVLGQFKLQTLNAARQPVVTKQPAQNAIVRPRLTVLPDSGAPGREAAKGGL